LVVAEVASGVVGIDAEGARKLADARKKFFAFMDPLWNEAVTAFPATD
jgi:hypothetical protein